MHFNEGNCLFDLSESLSYHCGDFDPSATVFKIEDSNNYKGKRMKY